MPPGIYPRPPMEPNAICDRCGKPFHIKPSKLARGRGRYCSRRCSKPYEDRPADEWFPEMLAWQGACLIWTGTCDHGGYGQLPHLVDGFHKAHRYAYFKAYGVDPGDLKVCHRCDNPPCCLPEHLFLGTDADNLADMWAKGRGYSPFPTRRGEANHRTTLTATKVLEIRSKYQPGRVTLKQLAAEYGVTFSSIHNIVTRRTWKHV